MGRHMCAFIFMCVFCLFFNSDAVWEECGVWRTVHVCCSLSDGANVALVMHATGVSLQRPAVGDLIIWKKTEAQFVGHVAVVCEVTDEYVRIAEQNADNNIMWGGGTYARQFPLQRHAETGAWTLRDDEDPLFGWVRVHPDQVRVQQLQQRLCCFLLLLFVLLLLLLQHADCCSPTCRLL
jgi:hypothetical protein